MPATVVRMRACTVAPTTGSPRSSVTVPVMAEYRQSGTSASVMRPPSASTTGCAGPDGRRRPWAPSTKPGFEADRLNTPAGSVRKAKRPWLSAITMSGVTPRTLSVTSAPGIGCPLVASYA